MTSKSLLRDRLEQRIAGLLAQHTDAIVHAWLKLGFLIPEAETDDADPLLREVAEQSPFAVAGILRERGLLGLTAAEATKVDAPVTLIGPPLPTAAELAAKVEANIQSAVARLIPDDAERRLTIERESLSQDWPLEAGPAWARIEAPYLTALAVLVSMEDRSRGGQAWPPSIAPLAVADALDAAGDELGRVVSDAIRNGYPVLFPPRQEEHAKTLEFFRWYRGEPGREGRLSFGLVQWNPAAVAVLLAALAEVRDAAALDTALGCARFAWANVVRLAGDLDALEQIAGDALRRSSERLRPMAQDARARDELARELQAHLRLVREATGLDGPEPRDEEEATALDGGILAVDARLFAYLAARGNEGSALEKLQRPKAEARAARFREDGKGAGLWHLWADQGTDPKGSRAALLLAVELWADVVAPRLHNSPSLVHPVMVDITAAHSRGFAPVTRGGQIVLPLPRGDWQIERSPDGAVAAVDAEAFRAIERGLTLLGGVTAHRLLRWEVFEGHTRLRRGEPNPADLVIDGGWSALAHDLLKMKGQKAVADVRAIVLAQGHLRFTLPGGGRGNLLSYAETPARGGRRGMVKIRLGDALLPGYAVELAQTMGDGVAARAARRLVPMVQLPPFVGREREHGPQATLSMIFVTELRERARELIEHGGILLDLDAWATLAERAALPRGGAGSLPRVLDRWTHDGPDGLAFLVKVGRDRYTLGPAHAAARDFVGEAGRRETEGSAAGKRSAARRARPRPRPRRTAKG